MILEWWQHMYEQFGSLQAYLVTSCAPIIDWIGGKIVVSISLLEVRALYKALSTMI